MKIVSEVIIIWLLENRTAANLSKDIKNHNKKLMNWIVKDVMLISFIVSGQIGITFHSQWKLRIILLCTFRIILLLSSQLLYVTSAHIGVR